MSKDTNLERLKDMVPFYVNGSLPDADRKLLEEALPHMPELREEIAIERAVQDRFRRGLATELQAATPPDAARMERLTAVPRPSGDNTAAPERLAGALSFLNPRNWKPAVTLALAAAAVGQLAVISGQSGTIADQGAQIARLEADNYALASGQGACDGEASIMVELRDDARWGEVAHLLAGERLLVTRSTAQGILMLRTVSSDPKDIEALIARLSASSLIASVSRAA